MIAFIGVRISWLIWERNWDFARLALSAVSAASVIPDLAEKGLINVSYVAGTNKPDQNTVMNYQRNFMDQWIKNGWVERTSRRTIRLTSNGRMVLDVFLDSYLIGL